MNLFTELLTATALLQEQEAYTWDFFPALVEPSCELRDVLLGDLDDLVQVGVVRPHRLGGGQRIELPPAAFHPLVEFPVLCIQPFATDVGLVAVLSPFAGAVQEQKACSWHLSIVCI